jgi:hypothetical protein
MARRTVSGGNAQDRRRARRAAGRRVQGTERLGAEDIAQIRELVAAATEVGVPDDSEELVIGADLTDEQRAQLAEALAPLELGGKPNPATKPDKRLKENQPGAKMQPEDEALKALEAYQAAVRCSCTHPFSEHSGAGGTCAHEDGRGTCRCGEFAYPESEPDVQALAAAMVAVRPDLEGCEQEIARIARRTLLALEAAAGDVAWGPEDGFVDLLCDVNHTLSGGRSDGYASEWCEPFDGPRAIDAGVKLDKVLICDGDDYFVAPITIDGVGEPVLSDRSDWVTVESGWIESPDDADVMSASAKFRFALRDVVLADGATAPAIPAEHEPAEILPGPSGEPTPAPADTARPTDGSIPWTATFVPEGVLTEDGRAFAPGALILPPDEGSRDLPLTLMAMIETSAEGGHDGAKVAGRIDQLWREGELVKAAGVFSKEEYGQQIARMVAEKELTGLSVDIAPLEWERGPRSDWFGDDGDWIAQQGEDGEWVPAGEPPSLEEAVERLFGGDEQMILVITKGVIGMATVCPFPAFGGASIALAASAGAPLYRFEGMTSEFEVDCDALVASGVEFDCGCTEETIETVPPITEIIEAVEAATALTAAAAGLAPVTPPAEWFQNPELTELTPMTITPDGRVYGHAWEWETCHLSFDGCVTAPHSETEYAYFRLGEIECEDGEQLAVGKITLDTAHAGQRLSRQQATRHYDHTGTVVAHVNFGEDEFGGWFAGAISPELSEEKLRLLRGATVSGDWRGVDGNLELIALLAVNVPGFPVPRQHALGVSDGENAEVVTLTAAGILLEGISAEQEAEIRELTAQAEV